MIHRKIEKWVPTLYDEMMEFHRDGRDDVSPESRKALLKLPVKRHAAGVWSAPILSPDAIAYFRAIGKVYADKFSVNDEEEKSAQIQELVLAEHCKSADYISAALGREVLKPLFFWLMGGDPEIFHTQLARYTPENTYKTSLHLDNDSLYTCVINLGGDYEGGGTKIYADGPMMPPVEIPPLSPGYGVFFHGKCTLHCGLPVTKGARELLVYWCE